MFNSCRRGPASICRLARIASSSVTAAATVRFAPASLAISGTPRFLVQARSFNVSSILRYDGSLAAAADVRDESLPSESPNGSETELKKFQHLSEKGHVHHNLISEIMEGMGHHTMTDVQALTIVETLKGTDVVAQARTGTGKTLGFLVPVIQRILNDDPELAQPPRYRSRARPSDVRAIIISPTRELAEQIAVEAKKLTRRTSVKVQIAVGGNSKTAMLRQVQREGCHVLVATPGRLNDLLTDPHSQVAAPNLQALVLDEADRLLDSGFSDAIEDIIQLLPHRDNVDRQTLLFSATMPKEVMHLVKRTLKPGFQFVQTVQEGEQATHEKVPQKIVQVRSFENLIPTIVEFCKREIERSTDSSKETKPFKAIIYFSSTANATLASRILEGLRSAPGDLFGRHPLMPAEVSLMHGKLTQAQRTRVSERFRRAKSAILCSSDVTARGMDFPNVTHVLQVGVPPSREQYIHRVGRTGRGDQVGEGWIFITPVEMSVARSTLRDLPIYPDESLEAAKVDMTTDAQLPAALATTLSQVGAATSAVDRDTKTAAFLAVLGTTQNIPNKQQLIDMLYQWTRFGWGWEEPPPINRALANKLNLNRVSGISMSNSQSSGDRGFSSRDSSSGYGRQEQRSREFGGNRERRGREFGSGDRKPQRGFGFDSGRGGSSDDGDRRRGSSSYSRRSDAREPSTF